MFIMKSILIYGLVFDFSYSLFFSIVKDKYTYDKLPTLLESVCVSSATAALREI